MPRNLDLTSLRSFVAVAETGGVTKAAGFLHLTQSAVSMQIKRLEENLGLSLLDRSGRSVTLTTPGEQLLSYARRMLELNDEVYAKMTDQAFEGEIVLGVPHDIVYPAIPRVLQQFHSDYPRVKVQLLSSFTIKLQDMFAKGECDVILTTEDETSPGGETLAEIPLVWVGAPGGSSWKQRPLKLAFEQNCVFRSAAQRVLDKAGVPWEMAVDSESSRTIEASVSADLAITAILSGMTPPYMAPLPPGHGLPDLMMKKINLYAHEQSASPMHRDLAETIRKTYRATSQGMIRTLPAA